MKPFGISGALLYRKQEKEFREGERGKRDCT
jgi:hypothetical protein